MNFLSQLLVMPSVIASHDNFSVFCILCSKVFTHLHSNTCNENLMPTIIRIIIACLKDLFFVSCS